MGFTRLVLVLLLWVTAFATPAFVYQLTSPEVASPVLHMVFFGAGDYSSFDHELMSNFYSNFIGSGSFSWLNEYSTVGRTVQGSQFTTNQTITTGSFSGQYSITDTLTTTQTRISVETTLTAKITSNTVPRPVLDAGGTYSNTLYILHFPKGTSVTYDTFGTSCVDWCGLHTTVNYSPAFPNLAYVLLPDNTPGSGNCFEWCGGTTNDTTKNLMSTASHEIMEAVTLPWRWTNNAPNTEVADSCQGQDQQFFGADGNFYLAQRAWSNTYSACIGNPHSTWGLVPFNNEYQSFIRGDTATYTISSTCFNTQACLNLIWDSNVYGVPDDWSVSISPSSGVAGTSTTLTITSGTAPLTYHPILSFEVRDSNGENFQKVQIKIEALASNLLNPIFANGLANWNQVYTGEVAYVDQFNAAVVVATPDTTKQSSIAQNVLVNFEALQVTYRAACTRGGILMTQADVGVAAVQLFKGNTLLNQISIDCAEQPIEAQALTVKPYHFFTQTISTAAYKGQWIDVYLSAIRVYTNLDHFVEAHFDEIIPIFYANPPQIVD